MEAKEEVQQVADATTEENALIEKKEKRKWKLTDKFGTPLGPIFNGKSPHQAALKAASKGHETIYLREKKSPTLHWYEGGRRGLTEHEHSEFTKTHKITSKPSATKKGIVKIKQASFNTKRATSKTKDALEKIASAAKELPPTVVVKKGEDKMEVDEGGEKA